MEKNGFVTVTKLGTTNIFFVAATKNFAAATKRFVDTTKHFVVVTKYFCYPYFNKWFCWYNKTSYTVRYWLMRYEMSRTWSDPYQHFGFFSIFGQKTVIYWSDFDQDLIWRSEREKSEPGKYFLSGSDKIRRFWCSLSDPDQKNGQFSIRISTYNHYF